MAALSVLTAGPQEPTGPTPCAPSVRGHRWAGRAEVKRRGPARPADAPPGGDLAPSFQPPPKLFRIGEVMAATGLSRQTIHNYTMMGLIREGTWSDGGHRLYPVEVFERLTRIVSLRVNHSLEEVLRILGPMNAATGSPQPSSS